ncbi:MAG TPA: flagellar motor switch protein FliG [Candidatus Binatia bacterium]|nr:flagellar motor switch protein FliG [Candidatus Binatia bacterium]
MAETALTPRPPRPPALPGAPRGLEKAAILLLTLGPDATARIFKHLNDAEVRQLAAAIADLRSIPREVAAAVHEEAWRRLTDRDGFLVDGEQFARQILAATTGKSAQDAEALREIERGQEQLARRLEKTPPPVLAQVLANEHPQVIALTLANLPPKQAADVLAQLPEAVQPEIVHRITDLQSVREEVLADVASVLQNQVQGFGVVSQTATGLGRAKIAAEIMNVADKAVEARVLTQLEADAPEVAETIRQLMFTFEDMVRLENRDIQIVLKEVAREDLMLALKTASPAMREKIFKNISARAAEILEEDMSAMGAVKLRDVERAQMNIVAVVRRLEAEQKITIAAGGDDVVV